MLLRSLPDLAQSNAEFQSWFQSKWGRENCIVWGRTRHAEFGPCTHTLSIRAAWGGVEHCHVNGGTLAVDDDNFLILNHGQIYSTSIRALRPVESLAICFNRSWRSRSTAKRLPRSNKRWCAATFLPERSPDFMENLHPHENTVSPVLRFIRMHVSRGVVDVAWYDEQLLFLLARMQCHHQRLLEQVDRIALIRPSTRREVYRRISLATGFMHTHYAQDIDLSTLAKMGYLSKYHFLWLFSLVHGMTPRTYLQRKCISVAIRLLESTRMTMSEVAASVGFAEESTLVRQMRRWTQMTPRQVRARVLDDRAA